MAVLGASRPLRRIPAIVSFLNPKPALSLVGGNRSSCPETGCVPADAPVSSEVPNRIPSLTRNVRGKNRCNSAHAELTENRLSFKSLPNVLGREGGISVISHCHRSNLDLLDSEPRPVCITKPLREQH